MKLRSLANFAGPEQSRKNRKRGSEVGERVLSWEICHKAHGLKGSPGGSMVKNLPTNAQDMGSILGLGRSSGEGNGNLFQYSCLGIPWTEEPGGL